MDRTYRSKETLGSHIGMSGVSPRILLKRMVTSEKTRTNQAISALKNVIRIMALARNWDSIGKKISQSENWLYNYRKRSLAHEMYPILESIIKPN